MDQREDHTKINFEYFQIQIEYFQIQKWMIQTVRAGKVDKNRVICLFSMFPSWVMAPKLFLKVHFMQFCADLRKKSKSVKGSYIYASERSRYALAENGTVYYVMIYCFRAISVWNGRILLNFCWLSIFFDIVIANI